MEEEEEEEEEEFSFDEFEHQRIVHQFQEENLTDIHENNPIPPDQSISNQS